jgi:hypothetical protein
MGILWHRIPAPGNALSLQRGATVEGIGHLA